MFVSGTLFWDWVFASTNGTLYVTFESNQEASYEGFGGYYRIVGCELIFLFTIQRLFLLTLIVTWFILNGP